MAKQPIHKSIKRRLGYDIEDSDEEVYADWKARVRRVCKPCWELRYCPYGPLVEQSPILPSEREGQIQHHKYLQDCLDTGMVGSEIELSDELREAYEEWLDDEQILIAQSINELRQDERYKAISKIEEKSERLSALLGGALPPIHEYRVDFFTNQSQEYVEEEFDPKIWLVIQDQVQKQRMKLKEALMTGMTDNRHPIEPARREMFEEMLRDFEPEDYPDSVPPTFLDGECSIFGHICPVFFAAEETTESEMARRIGRRHLRFETMMRIVRRDDYRCQHCMKQLRDDEVEFDHIIPVSKGGSSEEHNMRLTCYDCNRDKSADYVP